MSLINGFLFFSRRNIGADFDLCLSQLTDENEAASKELEKAVKLTSIAVNGFLSVLQNNKRRNSIATSASHKLRWIRATHKIIVQNHCQKFRARLETIEENRVLKAGLETIKREFLSNVTARPISPFPKRFSVEAASLLELTVVPITQPTHDIVIASLPILGCCRLINSTAQGYVDDLQVCPVNFDSNDDTDTYDVLATNAMRRNKFIQFVGRRNTTNNIPTFGTAACGSVKLPAVATILTHSKHSTHGNSIKRPRSSALAPLSLSPSAIHSQKRSSKNMIDENKNTGSERSSHMVTNTDGSIDFEYGPAPSLSKRNISNLVVLQPMTATGV